VLAEDHIVIDVDHVHYIVSVVVAQVLKDTQFNTCLVVVLLLVLDDLDSDILLLLVVDAAKGSTE